MRGSVAAIGCLLLLAGCSLWNSSDDSAGFGAPSAAAQASYVDRCIDVMQEVYPGASFEITGKRLGLGPNLALVDVKATRSNALAGGKTPRDVTVQCRFDGGVLMDFHWTASPL